MSIPEAVIVESEIRTDSFSELTRAVCDALFASKLPEISGWLRFDDRQNRTDGIEALHREVEGLTGFCPPSIRIQLQDDSAIMLSFEPAENLGVLHANFLCLPDEQATRGTVQSSAEFLRQLLRNARPRNGSARRQGGGAKQLPDVPLVSPTCFATIVDRSSVEEAYSDSTRFWQSGWDKIEVFGAHRLCTRATSAADGAEFLRQVQDQQRELARIANPFRSIYGGADLTDPAEAVVYRMKPPRLRVTGYLVEEQSLALTCSVSPHEHIEGWEIDDLRTKLEKQQIDDGRPLRSVRIYFPDEASLQREKRPILDIGAEVYFLDSTGDLIKVEQ